MNFRSSIGSLSGFIYRAFVGKLPFHCVRDLWLRAHLGSYGTGSSVLSGCCFLNGRKIFLGERNVINFGCLLDGRKFEIHTGSDLSMGPEAGILTLGHDPRSLHFEDRGGDVIIGDRVWIGYRAIILPGVIIGEGSVVGAGAVVTKNVDPFTIVAGNPAKPIGKRPRDLSYKLNFRPWLG